MPVDVQTQTYVKSTWATFFNYVLKQCFKKSHLNSNEGESDGPRPSFSGKWGTKLHQTDGEKCLLKWGIYIGATACKNLANIKKQQKHVDWIPTESPR